jgi:hypothetical protein
MAIMAPVVAVIFVLRQYASPMVIYPTGVILMIATGTVALRHILKFMPETTLDNGIFRFLRTLMRLDVKTT